MKFKIPFTMASLDKLKKRAAYLRKYIKYRKNSPYGAYLENSDMNLTREEYLSIVLNKFIILFVVLILVLMPTLVLAGISSPYLISFGVTILFSAFVGFSQIMYPKLYIGRKQKNIEKNLIPALEDMLVQLNSGIPLFSILVNIATSDYGELSKEFKKAVRKINAGIPQIDVLEELGEKNISLYFRRTLWQLSNGMRTGSDISVVIRDSIKSLSEEQIVQIQNYGNKLNPLIMFYMLISVILPALSITFLTILSSLVNLPASVTTLMFISMFVFVIIIQLMFLGTVRSLRPSLL
ncbi:type II secretion system F family protein [Candidatus Pacearchaeota archaeon]|nr:type II secretion system F family protein [Candidatus Pacearchaeota archaeon]